MLFLYCARLCYFAYFSMLCYAMPFHIYCTQIIKLKRLCTQRIIATLLHQAMGSIDWAACFYCEYWAHNPYLLDPDGMALCPWCWDFILVDGGTAESTEHWWCFYQQGQQRELQRRLHRARWLQNLRLLPAVLRIDSIIHTISSY